MAVPFVLNSVNLQPMHWCAQSTLIHVHMAVVNVFAARTGPITLANARWPLYRVLLERARMTVSSSRLATACTSTSPLALR